MARAPVESKQGRESGLPVHGALLADPPLQADRREQLEDLHAGPGLAQAPHSARPLIQPHGGPGQIVVHHPAGSMQVHALARDVGGHEHRRHQMVRRGCGCRSEPAEHTPPGKRGTTDPGASAGAPGNPPGR